MKWDNQAKVAEVLCGGETNDGRATTFFSSYEDTDAQDPELLGLILRNEASPT